MLTIECRADQIESFPSPWRVEVDFAQCVLRFSARGKAYPKRIEVETQVFRCDTWGPIGTWETKLSELVTRTAHQGSRGFSHTPYQVIMGDRTVDLHADGLIAFFVDPEVRIPMRFIIKRLVLLRRFLKNRDRPSQNVR